MVRDCNARLINNSEMKEIENPSDVKWVPDTLCQNPSSEGCLKYHSGAAGCLRSNRPTDDNAGQQCCYGSDGKLRIRNTAIRITCTTTT